MGPGNGDFSKSEGGGKSPGWGHELCKVGTVTIPNYKRRQLLVDWLERDISFRNR